MVHGTAYKAVVMETDGKDQPAHIGGYCLTLWRHHKLCYPLGSWSAIVWMEVEETSDGGRAWCYRVLRRMKDNLKKWFWEHSSTPTGL